LKSWKTKASSSGWARLGATVDVEMLCRSKFIADLQLSCDYGRRSKLDRCTEFYQGAELIKALSRKYDNTVFVVQFQD
jgi:hypothetical protein